MTETSRKTFRMLLIAAVGNLLNVVGYESHVQVYVFMLIFKFDCLGSLSSAFLCFVPRAAGCYLCC